MVDHTNFQQIFDSLSTAVLVLDESLTINFMNASAEMLLSVSGKLMEGRALADCFIEMDDTSIPLIEESLRENKNFTKRKACWMTHGNQLITVDYSVTPSIELNKIIIEIQPLDRLIRISREEALLSSQETSRNLVKSLAHEIKNPLGGIRGAAQLLARELSNEDLDEYTKIIIDETDRLRNLVDRMLGPRSPAVRKQINIHEVLERVLTIIKAEVDDQIDLDRDYDPSIPDVLADKEQLIQATLNIARNAMQSLLESPDPTSEPKKILFSTRVQRRYTIGRTYYPLVARIGIHDNGPGIPPEIADDIFFPMITGRVEGSGVGLAISQNIIGQHNGLIECESQKGSTEFVIYLPLENSHE